jgi:hypothetical protein
MIADVWLVSYADGSRIVAKTLTDAPGDLFAIEAEGLAALHAAGQLRTPQVLAMTSSPSTGCCATCTSPPPGKPWTPATGVPWNACATGCHSSSRPCPRS